MSRRHVNFHLASLSEKGIFRCNEIAHSSSHLCRYSHALDLRALFSASHPSLCQVLLCRSTANHTTVRIQLQRALAYRTNSNCVLDKPFTFTRHQSCCGRSETLCIHVARPSALGIQSTCNAFSNLDQAASVMRSQANITTVCIKVGDCDLGPNKAALSP